MAGEFLAVNVEKFGEPAEGKFKIVGEPGADKPGKLLYYVAADYGKSVGYDPEKRLKLYLSDGRKVGEGTGYSLRPGVNSPGKVEIKLEPGMKSSVQQYIGGRRRKRRKTVKKSKRRRRKSKRRPRRSRNTKRRRRKHRSRRHKN